MIGDGVVVRRRRDGRHVADSDDVALSPRVGRPSAPRVLRQVGIAMIGQCCMDLNALQLHSDRAKAAERVNAAEWRRWLSDTDHGWPYSFVNCALYVGVDPAGLRQRLQREVLDRTGPRRRIVPRYGAAA